MVETCQQPRLIPKHLTASEVLNCESWASRVTGALTARVGARVMGEHRHPALVKQFTVLEGGLSIFEIWWTRGDSNPRPPRCER